MNLGNKIFYSKWLHIVLISLVFAGALNWLSIGIFGIDIVRLGLAPRNAKWVYIIIGLAALSLVVRWDMYLPFLGETVLPGGALTQKTPQNANEQVSIKTLPNAKIVYWAAEPDPTQGTDVKQWKEAYDEFENSGVAVADKAGNALLRFRGPPQAYSVPLMGRLESHVHFRICDNDGMMGPVQIMMIKNGMIENFSSML
jgi:uncharacterized membrane protein YuzA (DUF378 family)